MQNLNKYGNSPFKIVLVHGGPGAAGQLTPLAKELKCKSGIIEAIQTKKTISLQIKELYSIITEHADVPVILVGHSWGSWLCCLFAARHPSLIKKIILISSGPFEEKYSSGITETRMNRMSQKEKEKYFTLIEELNNPLKKDKNFVFYQLGCLISKADSYKQITGNNEYLDCNYGIYQKVWTGADKLRKSGKLLSITTKIQCPVVIIHGDYDPHPYEGITKPLSTIIKDIRFYLLEKCGHEPWNEEYAKDRFVEILVQEMDDGLYHSTD